MSFFSCQVCNKDFTDNYSIVQCCDKMLCQECFDKITEDEEPDCPYCTNDDIFLEGLEIKEFDDKDKYIIKLDKYIIKLDKENDDKDKYIIKLEKENKEKKEKKEKNSIDKKVVTKKDRTFTGYVMKYIPDETELIMTNKGDEIKCVVDYSTQSFLDDEGEQHKSLNMVYTKFYKKAGAEKIGSKNCWDCFMMDGKKIKDLYVTTFEVKSNNTISLSIKIGKILSKSNTGNFGVNDTKNYLGSERDDKSYPNLIGKVIILYDAQENQSMINKSESREMYKSYIGIM